MNFENLNKLAVLIGREREALVSQWREQVRRKLPSVENLDTLTLDDHIPRFLDELACAFRLASDETNAEALLDGSPPPHGLQRYQDGFDIVELVGEYNILRGCIHDLAEHNGLSLEGSSFHILNSMFDEAISLAVQTFAARQALEVLRRREDYLAFVAHDLRTPLNAISLAARVLERAS
jgi:two-component system, OmpR family, phosphate regulon sensor histidine kinase PhoR